MFREMRRDRQQLSQADAEEILKKNTGGTLALVGDEGYPSAVPMSYVYSDGKLYFHSADTGHKIDAVARHEKASFCVIDQDLIVPEKYTTFFRSVIAFGRIRRIEDPEEMARSAVRELLLARESSSRSFAMVREATLNAAKHNVISAANPLVVSICSDGESISVTNNIIPKVTQVSSTGLGQKYIRQQYQNLCGKEIAISLNAEEYKVVLPLI